MALFFKIVPEYQRVIRFKFGRYDLKPRGPGLIWVVPFMHKLRVVDLREDVVELAPQKCITKDNAPVTIDLIVFMRVVNPESSVMQVANYRYAAESIAVTTLRSVVGDISLDDVLAQREQINTTMREKLDEVTERWGVKVNAVEIREILPPAEIQTAMSRQMSAERGRRAVVTEAEGTREAAITIADGNRQAVVLQAQGQKEATILEAEAKRQAAVLNAEGFALALQKIFETASGIDEKTMGLQYLDMMKVLGSSPAAKWIVPMEMTSFFQGIVGNFAGAAQPAAAAVTTPPPATPA